MVKFRDFAKEFAGFFREGGKEKVKKLLIVGRYDRRKIRRGEYSGDRPEPRFLVFLVNHFGLFLPTCTHECLRAMSWF